MITSAMDFVIQMDHLTEDELRDKASDLLLEIATLEAKKSMIQNTIHDKRIELNRLIELLEIKGTNM